MLTSSMKMIMRVPIWSKKKTVNPISSAHHNLTFPNSQPACKKKRRMERGDTHWRTVCITHPLLHCRFHSPLENVRGGRTGEGNLLVLGLDGGSAAKQKTPEPVNMSEKKRSSPTCSYSRQTPNSCEAMLHGANLFFLITSTSTSTIATCTHTGTTAIEAQETMHPHHHHHKDEYNCSQEQRGAMNSSSHHKTRSTTTSSAMSTMVSRK